MTRAWLFAWLTTATACTTVHSQPQRRIPPGRPLPEVEIGAVVDEAGVDLGPLLAARLTATKMAAARTRPSPSGAAPFVSGSLRLQGEGLDRHTGRQTAGAFFGTFAACGVAFLLLANAADAIADGSEADDVRRIFGTVGGISLAFGGVGLAGVLGSKRGGMSARATADLTVRTPAGEERPLSVDDQMELRFDDFGDGGRQLLDGVARGIAAALYDLPSPAEVADAR